MSDNKELGNKSIELSRENSDNRIKDLKYHDQNEVKTFINKLPLGVSYTDFRHILMNKIQPIIRDKFYFYRWYGYYCSKGLNHENVDG